MKYNDKILDHFHNPRHVGVLNPDNPMVGTALLGVAERGDVVQLQIQLTSKGVIETATFQAQASVPTMALCSLATTLLIGKTLHQAQKISAQELAEELSLAKTKMHCALLVADAIQKALADLQEKVNSQIESRR